MPASSSYPTAPCTHCGKPAELNAVAVERLELKLPIYCDVCKTASGVPFRPGCPHGWAAPSICLTCTPAPSTAPNKRLIDD